MASVKLSGPTSNWIEVVDRSIQKFKAGEKKAWDRNLRTFLGDFWGATTVGESEAELIKTSTNFVLPLVETAQANLMPPNPRVVLNPRTPANRDQVEQGSTIVNYFLQRGKWRRETAHGIFNVMISGRCPFKTVWDYENDVAISRFLDPRNYFFDTTAQRFEDMKYEIEATLLTRRQMEKKVEEGIYPKWAMDIRSAEQYPTWLLPEKDKRELRNLSDFQKWYLVYEVYDREAGVVFHYLPSDKRPILEDELLFRPYDLLTFTYNGTDCGGVSEVGLIMANQEDYNWTETFLLNELRTHIPVDYYDARITSSDKEEKKLQAPLGSKVPIKVPAGAGIADVFYRPPPPPLNPMAQDQLARKREGMAYTSAMSDSMRAQTIGAKTATEMEWIKQQVRDRLGPRLATIDELTESVAAKQFFLAQRYMREEKVVRLVGDKEWRVVNPFTLEGVEATFDIVAYNAMKMSPAIRLEALRNLQPILVNNPWVKQRKLAEALLRDVQADDPESFLLTEEEFAAQQQAAQQPPPDPGPTPAEPPMSPSTPLAPESAPEPGGLPPGGPTQT